MWVGCRVSGDTDWMHLMLSIRDQLIQIMETLALLCALSEVVFVSSAHAQDNGSLAADYVLRNGRVYTLIASGDTAQAIAVRGERIVYVGTDEGVEPYVGDATKTINLVGKTVLPGFTDAHMHPISGGLARLECDLTGIEDSDDIIAALAAFARTHPKRSWVRGTNFSLAAFPQGNPQRHQLDAVIADRPVYVKSTDGHNVWVNTKALSSGRHYGGHARSGQRARGARCCG